MTTGIVKQKGMGGGKTCMTRKDAGCKGRSKGVKSQECNKRKCSKFVTFDNIHFCQFERNIREKRMAQFKLRYNFNQGRTYFGTRLQRSPFLLE